ncbi:hypothetical protein J6590_002718 [Homalodisca vitripennis]|nr:hypothetical protein J6590_002718 [Homalodisca vitripennis]
MECTHRRLLILQLVAFLVAQCCTTTAAQDKCANVKCPAGSTCQVERPICRRCPPPQPEFTVCRNNTSG